MSLELIDYNGTATSVTSPVTLYIDTDLVTVRSSVGGTIIRTVKSIGTGSFTLKFKPATGVFIIRQAIGECVSVDTADPNSWPYNNAGTSDGNISWNNGANPVQATFGPPKAGTEYIGWSLSNNTPPLDLKVVVRRP